MSPWQSALIHLLYTEKGVSLRKIQKEFPKFSLATVYRHATSSVQDIPLIKKKTGRPKKVTLRNERKLIRTLHTLHDMDKGVTSKQMQLEAGLTYLSNSTVRGILNKIGYRYLQTRRKGLLSKEDLKCRKEFAHNIILYPDTVWKKDICVYLDGSSFVHKTHAADQTRAPVARIRKKTNEGLKQGLTSKGKKAGGEGRVIHFIVSISYGKGVCFCEQSKKMNGR